MVMRWVCWLPAGCVSSKPRMLKPPAVCLTMLSVKVTSRTALHGHFSIGVTRRQHDGISRLITDPVVLEHDYRQS